MEFEKKLIELKYFFKAKSNKDLAIKIGLSEDGVKNWIRKKEIPQRYLKLLDSGNDNQIINTNSGNNVKIENNHGHININSSDEMSMEICKEIKKLSDVKKEYFYHLIKAEVLKDSIS